MKRKYKITFLYFWLCKDNIIAHTSINYNMKR